ncbi:hypothetical protein ACRAWF_43080 [Streptomyces sp. L7]
MAAHREDHKTVRHPVVGAIDVDCDVLTDGDSELKIVILTAAPGSSDEGEAATGRRRTTARPHRHDCRYVVNHLRSPHRTTVRGGRRALGGLWKRYDCGGRSAAPGTRSWCWSWPGIRARTRTRRSRRSCWRSVCRRRLSCGRRSDRWFSWHPEPAHTRGFNRPWTRSGSSGRVRKSGWWTRRWPPWPARTWIRSRPRVSWCTWTRSTPRSPSSPGVR